MALGRLVAGGSGEVGAEEDTERRASKSTTIYA